MRRLSPSLFALTLLLVAACLRHAAPASPVAPEVGVADDPRRLPDGGFTPEALFDFHLLVAAVFLDAGQPGVAGAELVQAVAEDPTHPDAAEALSRAAFAYERAGDRTRARQTHEHLVRAYPKWPHLDFHWFRIAVLAEDERDLERAQAAYEELLGNHFDAGARWDALFNLARVREQRGLLREAHAAYVRWAQEQPNDPDRLSTELHAATLLSRVGDPAAEREALLGILSKHQATSIDPRRLAWVRVRLKQLAEGGVLAKSAGDGGWVRSLPDGGRAARFTDFTPVPPTLKPPDSSCIGKARDGGCVFSFREREDVRPGVPRRAERTNEDDEVPPLDGGAPDSPPRLSFAAADAESFVLEFEGGSCGVTALVVDGGCWVQLSGVVQDESRSLGYTRYSIRDRASFVACGAGVDLCDNRWRCDCAARLPPPGFTAMPTDGGERTGNTRPKRRP